MSMNDKNNFDGRYEHLISVEYRDDAPFSRTVIVEFDSIKGKRTTCLGAKLNEIISECCEAVQLISQKEREKYISQSGALR